jgi:hypothetical protein
VFTSKAIFALPSKYRPLRYAGTAVVVLSTKLFYVQDEAKSLNGTTKYKAPRLLVHPVAHPVGQ